jgi:hypothetical protein
MSVPLPEKIVIFLNEWQNLKISKIKCILGLIWWYMPTISATQEVDIGRLISQSLQAKLVRFYL